MAFQVFAPSPAWAKSSSKARKAKAYYPIRYRLNGGKHPKKQVLNIKRGTYVSVNQIKKPKRRGYKFQGWYTDRRLTKKAKGVYGRGLATKRTLYAKWKAVRYRISYNLNGGKAAKRLPTSYTIESTPIVPYPPTRRGYRFLGWYADGKFKKRRASIRAGSTGDIKFYARWELAHYSIKYELDGGVTMLPLPNSYSVKTSTITPFPPTKSGYRFAGWFADPGFKTQRSSIRVGSTGDITLYAKWVPVTYWDAHLEEKCARVNELANGNGSGVPSVVFITDMHIPSNALVSPYLIREVVSRTGSNMVVFGGDALNGQGKKSDALAMLRFIRSSSPGSEVHFVRGNHDANTEGANIKKNQEISRSEYLAVVAGANESRESGSLDYCRDDKKNKVRYIFMDTGAPNSAYVSTLQLAWLKERILELEEGWTVLLFVHQFFKTYPGYDTNGKLIKRLLDKIYDESKAEIAGVVSGHVHRDRIEVSSKGYPMIATACDAYAKASSADAVSRKLGTTSEQAFDVITLDTAKKMIYLTRIGFGNDRAFRYAEVDEEPAPAQPDSGDGLLQVAEPGF